MYAIRSYYVVDIGEKSVNLIDGTDNVVYVVFYEEDCSVVICFLYKFFNNLDAFFISFFGFVFGVVNPVALGVVGSCFRNYVGSAQVTGVTA